MNWRDKLSIGALTVDTLTLGNTTFNGGTEVVTTTNIITADENGKTFFLDSTTGFTSTLPAPAAGLKFKFIVSKVNTSGNSVIATNGAAAILRGSADVLSTRVGCAAQKQANIIASTTVLGDWLEFTSDGASWFVTGVSSATGGFTFTAP